MSLWITCTMSLWITAYFPICYHVSHAQARLPAAHAISFTVHPASLSPRPFIRFHLTFSRCALNGV